MIVTIVCDLPVPGGWASHRGKQGYRREQHHGATYTLDQTQSLAQRHRDRALLARI